ncbi:MAG TPA: RNase adapter RapZ [Acetobacteraceae bacterium]|nr:RNase adapter RapZ [Acetobacteraceae bacterium]
MPAEAPEAARPRRVVLVTGLSGAGRSSILHVLEDLGYEAVDNPPLPLMEELVTRGDRPAAIGVDSRSRGFEPAAVLHTLARLRLNPALRPELIFAWADEPSLLRRYTETRRRHPLAPRGRVIDGILAEDALLTSLREAADLVLDTSRLSIPALRATIERRLGAGAESQGMTVSVMSFAYGRGLPTDADLVFDVRFLRNPHYEPTLRPGTGLDAPVAAFIAADPAYEPFMDKVTDLLSLLLPRFVTEGKKYAGIAIGCTGGRHRSVHVAQQLAERIRAMRPPCDTSMQIIWRVTLNHRDLSGELADPEAASSPRSAAVDRDSTGPLWPAQA